MAGPLVRDHVDVDVLRQRHDRLADAPAGEESFQPTAAARTEDQLGGVLRHGEVHQGGGYFVADDGVVAAAEAFDEGPLSGQRRMRDAGGEPVAPGDVYGEQFAAGGPARDACRAADEGLTLRATGESHHDPLPGLPDVPDAVLGAVLVEGFVHTSRQPQERQLPQCDEVAGTEVVRQRGIDPLRRTDVAVRHPAPQPLGRYVDQLDLVGAAHELVGYGLPLRHPGDLLDDVAE